MRTMAVQHFLSERSHPPKICFVMGLSCLPRHVNPRRTIQWLDLDDGSYSNIPCARAMTDHQARAQDNRQHDLPLQIRGRGRAD
jgi:hypothetical protein